jgi:hypothetical protein
VHITITSVFCATSELLRPGRCGLSFGDPKARPRTITSLHDSLYSAIVVLNTIHAAENFHAALHSMLNVTRKVVAEPNARAVPEDWNEMRESTTKALDTLRESLQQFNIHGQHAEVPGQHPSEAIAALFTRLMVELDAALSGPALDIPSHMTAAGKLFDEIFQDHLDKLHVGHQQHFDDLKADAHGLERQIDLLFYGQTLFVGIVVLIALFFSERDWSKAICVPRTHHFRIG